MAHHFFKRVKNTIKYWYLPLLAGIVLLVIGIWTFMNPGDSYVALAFLFSISFIVSGLFESIFSVVNRDLIDNWGWQLVTGIFTLIVGFLMLINPEISMITLPFYIGFVVLFRSMAAIGVALDLRNFGILSWGNLMLIGVLGVLLAVILLWNPLFAGLSAVVLTGIALIVAGVFNIIVSLKLKKIHDVPRKISRELLKR
ncbi:MAG: DUF308 domain-containing protein, partial [Flavobacteriaceae bacterium]